MIHSISNLFGFHYNMYHESFEMKCALHLYISVMKRSRNEEETWQRPNKLPRSEASWSFNVTSFGCYSSTIIMTWISSAFLWKYLYCTLHLRLCKILLLVHELELILNWPQLTGCWLWIWITGIIYWIAILRNPIQLHKRIKLHKPHLFSQLLRTFSIFYLMNGHSSLLS